MCEWLKPNVEKGVLTPPLPYSWIEHFDQNHTQWNDAAYTVSVRRTRLNVTVLLTLALAEESPTYILNEDTQPVTIEVSHAACKAEF